MEAEQRFAQLNTAGVVTLLQFFGEVGVSSVAHSQARLDGGRRQSNKPDCHLTEGCDVRLTA